MKRLLIVLCCALGVVFVAFVNDVKAGEWRIPVGISYAGGLSDIVDLHEDNLDAELLWMYGGWYEAESVNEVPVGLAVRPYYLFNNGLGIGVDIGPVMYIGGDVTFTNVPVNVNCRFALTQFDSVLPYVRVGVSHHFASGDYVEDSGPGAFGAIGFEFLKNSVVGWGFEFAYDSSEIEFDEYDMLYTPYSSTGTKKIKPIGLTASIFAVF